MQAFSSYSLYFASHHFIFFFFFLRVILNFWGCDRNLRVMFLRCLLSLPLLYPFESFWLCLLLVVLKIYIAIAPGSRLRPSNDGKFPYLLVVPQKYSFFPLLFNLLSKLSDYIPLIRCENHHEGDTEPQTPINCDSSVMVNFQICLFC